MGCAGSEGLDPPKRLAPCAHSGKDVNEYSHLCTDRALASRLLTPTYMKTLIASGLIALATLSAGCTAPASEDDVAAGEDQLATAFTIDERGNGKTFTIESGTDFTVALGTSTGFQWKVARTTRALGYPSPKEGTYQPPAPDAPVGSGGKQLFTWKTSSPLLQPGAIAHAVTLEYRAAGDDGTTPPPKTFTFKLEIKAATVAPPPAPPITLYAQDDGVTVTAAEGQNVAVRLPQDTSTGFAWFVESVDRTLGQPAKTVEGPPEIAVFSWATNGPFSKLGSHRVTLKSSIGATGAATEQFSFTLNIVAAAPGGGFACPPASLSTISCAAPAASPYCGPDYRWFAATRCNVRYVD